MTANAAADQEMLSISNIPDNLLPAFSPIEKCFILVCKVVTGKMTEEQAVKILAPEVSNGNKQKSDKK